MAQSARDMSLEDGLSLARAVANVMRVMRKLMDLLDGTLPSNDVFGVYSEGLNLSKL